MQIVSKLIDTIFPPVCHLCSMPLVTGDFFGLCQNCEQSIERISGYRCTRCGLVLNGAECPDCKNLPNPAISFDYARSYARYAGYAKVLVHKLKYEQQPYVAQTIAQFLFTIVKEVSSDKPKANFVLAPIPVHPTTNFVRGFSHTALIAKHLSTISGIECNTQILIKTRHTKKQASLFGEERLANINGAFAVKESVIKKYKDKTVIIIDDVMTSGATAAECASVLKSNEIKSVRVLTFCRTY